MFSGQQNQKKKSNSSKEGENEEQKIGNNFLTPPDFRLTNSEISNSGGNGNGNNLLPIFSSRLSNIDQQDDLGFNLDSEFMDFEFQFEENEDLEFQGDDIFYVQEFGGMFAIINGRKCFLGPATNFVLDEGIPLNEAFEQPLMPSNSLEEEQWNSNSSELFFSQENPFFSNMEHFDLPLEEEKDQPLSKNQTKEPTLKLNDKIILDDIDEKMPDSFPNVKIEEKQEDKMEESSSETDWYEENNDTKDNVGLEYYGNKISEQLEESKNFEIDDSSGSELDDEELEKRKIKKEAYQKGRRKVKAKQIESIAKTALPLEDDELEEFNNLQESREKDFESRKDKQGKYTKETAEKFLKWGEKMKETSLYHNSYLRRAYRDTIDKKLRHKATSKDYNSNQKKMRPALLKVLQKDNDKMKWTREDFSSDKIWEIVQFMLKNEMSNNKRKTVKPLKDDPKDDKSSSLMAFHHVAWKEGMDGKFTDYALHAPNLVARHDERWRKEDKKNPKKVNPRPGFHEFDHQSMGFMAEQKWGGERKKKGGQFKSMDPEAVYYVNKPLLKKRESKRDQYIREVKKRSRENELPKNQSIVDGFGTSAKKKKTGGLSISDLLNPVNQDLMLNIDFPTTKKEENQLQIQSLSEENKSKEKDFNVADFEDWVREWNMNQPRDWGLNESTTEFGNFGIGSLQQSEHECGQMAVHNALTMNGVGNGSMLNVMGNINSYDQFMNIATNGNFLNQLGNFENDINDDQVMQMLAQNGGQNIAVVSDVLVMRSLMQYVAQDDLQGLSDHIGENLFETYLPGLIALNEFATGATNSITLVLNTTAMMEDNYQGYHWIAVRIERDLETNALRSFYMDSVPGLGPYNELIGAVKDILFGN